MQRTLFGFNAALVRGVIVAGIVLGIVVGLSACSSDAALAVPPCESTGDESVARKWNKALLDAIRRDFPAPTVHARNLFHLSAAMWDAWALYDADASGYFIDRKLTIPEDRLANERATAISIAAHQLLTHRYEQAVGGDESVEEFDDLLTELCGTDLPTRSTADADSAVGAGYEISDSYIAFGRSDGSLEQSAYLDFSYEPANPPLVVAGDWEPMVDPNRWQPLALDSQVSQNGIVIPSATQTAIGPHWGSVVGFALSPNPHPDGLPVDPGTPPLIGSKEFNDAALEVIRRSSLLASDTEIDVSPATLGDNPLGTDDGTGHRVNPSTGEPYASNTATEADFYRVLAEFWADGPDSETPPGHWNTLANNLVIAAEDRIIGGPAADNETAVDALEWDVKLYFALNGATHDAAIAAWGAKAAYDYSRPISMIRHLSAIKELPLEPRLSEVITPESSSAGQRHEDLADHVGEIAVYSWLGSQDPPGNDQTVGWVLGTRWLPYQRDTFVTPSFPGYVSGHSTFSRAAAEVLTRFTGSEYFPGGLGTWTVQAGDLEFESGPASDVQLQWATYYDAADQAGESRLWGGIHVPVDDYNGRIMGAKVGQDAWAKAQKYFG